jgi:hypothetical protein
VDELHAGHARADDDEVLGQLARRVGLPGGEHAVAVGLGPIGDPGPAAGRDEDGVRLELVHAAHVLDDHGVRALEPADAAVELDPLALQQLSDRPLQPFADGADPLAEGGEVHAAGRLGQAEPLDPAQERHGAAGGDHGLGRDAVPQVGGAPDDVLLDQRHLGAEPGGVRRRRVARRSAADDHQAQGHGHKATGRSSPACSVPPGRASG